MSVLNARISALQHQGITNVYLAGPMSGIVDHNFPAFNQWTADLLAFFEITNPAHPDDLNEDGTSKAPWEQYLARDVRLVTDADAVMALPNWRISRGATFELLVATMLGKRCFDLAAAEDASRACELEPSDVFQAFGERWGALTGLEHSGFKYSGPQIDRGGLSPRLAEILEGRIAGTLSVSGNRPTGDSVRTERLVEKIFGEPGENEPTFGMIPEDPDHSGPEPGEHESTPAPGSANRLNISSGDLSIPSTGILTLGVPCRLAEPPPQNILEEANEIIHGPRGDDYGHPLDNHTITADFFSTYLGIEITAEQVCFLNILQKISRGMNRVTRDTLVDIAGYAGNTEMVQLERAAREGS